MPWFNSFFCFARSSQRVCVEMSSCAGRGKAPGKTRPARRIPETAMILMKVREFMYHVTVADAGFEPQAGGCKFSFLQSDGGYGYGLNAGKTMNCPGCGNTVAETDQFCSKCFARLEPPGFWRKFLSLFQSAGQSRPPIVVNIKKTVSIKTVDKDGERHECHSLDEVPPEMRAEFEKLESEVMKEKGQAVSFTETSPTRNAVTSGLISKQSVSVFRIKDASGNERIYHSLDELPPDIRAQFERAQKQIEAQK
jgi:hypothetical protein